MNITTKFSIGDKVFRIFKDHIETTIACTVCGDTKKVNIKGTDFICPACQRGCSNWHDRWFVHQSATTVGEVKTATTLKAHHSCNYFDESEIVGDTGITVEQYMLSATGVGSGTFWNHNELFLTLDEAQKEADKRNEAIIATENNMPV